jgi:hypothetical protein
VIAGLGIVNRDGLRVTPKHWVETVSEGLREETSGIRLFDGKVAAEGC